jgi:hypothetical protein
MEYNQLNLLLSAVLCYWFAEQDGVILDVGIQVHCVVRLVDEIDGLDDFFRILLLFRKKIWSIPTI